MQIENPEKQENKDDAPQLGPEQATTCDVTSPITSSCQKVSSIRKSVIIAADFQFLYIFAANNIKSDVTLLRYFIEICMNKIAQATSTYVCHYSDIIY